MNKATVCIGSNYPEGFAKVEAALKWLKSELQSCISYGPYPTVPYGEGASDAPYFNAVATGFTCFTARQLTLAFNPYDTVNGRVHGSSFPAGIAIDIDLVVWNDTVLRPADYSAPYFTEGMRHLPDLQ